MSQDTSPPTRRSGLVRPRIARISGYIPGEQPTDPGVLKLNTNENPYPPSPAVAAAIARASDRLHLYPDPTARGVRLAAGALYDVDPAGVVVGNGSDELLSLLIRTVVEPGDAVAYPVPTYSLYDTLVELQAGRSLHFAFGDDFALPEALFTAPARLFFVCNPNSPSGSITPVEVLERFVAGRSDAVVVVDEAYADFADQNALSLVRRFPNVAVLRTFSKSYSLAGLRVGLLLTNPALAAEVNKVKDSYNVDRLSQAGAIAALEDQATMRANVGRIRATRARVTAELRRLGFSVADSHTNFVLARTPGRSLEAAAHALKERGILVRWFRDLADSLRISIGTDAQMDSLLASLTEAKVVAD